MCRGGADRQQVLEVLRLNPTELTLWLLYATGHAGILDNFLTNSPPATLILGPFAARTPNRNIGENLSICAKSLLGLDLPSGRPASLHQSLLALKRPAILWLLLLYSAVTLAPPNKAGMNLPFPPPRDTARNSHINHLWLSHRNVWLWSWPISAGELRAARSGLLT